MIRNSNIKNGVKHIYLDKILTDKQMLNLQNTFVKQSQIKLFVNYDANVYDENDNLLLLFRKRKLKQSNIDMFYDSIIKSAMTETSNRGSASGSKKKNIANNPKIKSNIFGYFDTFAPTQKLLLKKNNIKNVLKVRETRFNMDNPILYSRTLPLIKQIDSLYKLYIPDKYKLQIKKANQTYFRIPQTSFTTITTNVNYRTTLHKDKGDDVEGFGNLTVISKGKYSGAETCFPQYGVGVDVRCGDILFMNVHEWHGNLPMKMIDKDAIRLSVVCYLRYNIWLNTKGVSKQEMEKHNNMIRNLRVKKTVKNKKSTSKSKSQKTLKRTNT